MADDFTTGKTIAIKITGDARPLKQALKATETAVARTGRVTRDKMLYPMLNDARRAKYELGQVQQQMIKIRLAAKDAAIEAQRNMAAQVAAQAAAVRAARTAARNAAWGELKGAYGRVRSTLGTVVGVGAAAAFVTGIRSAKKFKDEITDIQITSGKSAEYMARLEKEVIAVSNASGRSKEEVASYLSTLVTATGDVDYARNSLKQMSDVAVATGANLGDLAAVNVKLGSSFGIAAKDAYQAWNIIRAGEKAGSVTVKNFAQYFGKPASLAGLFGARNKGIEGLKSFSGLFQLSARAYGLEEPGGAAIGMERFLQNLAQRAQKNPNKLAKMLGVSVGQLGQKTAKGFQFNQLTDVIRAIGEAAAKDPGRAGKYGKELFGIQGVRVYNVLREAAAAGWTKKSGTYASLQSLFNVGRTDELGGDLATRKKSVGFRFGQAWQKVQNEWYKAMVPAMTKLADIMPTLAKGLTFVISNIKELIMLWLGTKLTGAIMRIAAASRAAGAASMGAGVAGAAGAGTGAGGAAGAAGGVVVMAGRSRWSQVGSGALAALPLIPVAVMVGKKLGEAWAGTTLEKIKEAERDIAEQGSLNRKWRAWNTGGRTNYRSVMRSLTDTEEGAKRQGAIRGMFKGLLRSEEGWELDPFSRYLGKQDEWNFNYGKVFARGGAKGGRALKGQLFGYYAAMRQETETALRTSGHVGKIDQAALERNNPMLALYRAAIEKIDHTLAQIEKARQKGQTFKVHSTATVDLRFLSDPGSRVAVTAGKATDELVKAGRTAAKMGAATGDPRALLKTMD